MGIVDTAKMCLGRVKYVFGANQINSDGSGVADCSSFTQWVFKQNGINIGRNTEAQLSHGTKVDKRALQPGDLVFFKDTYASNYKDGVSHVGIYIGNNEFIHNSSGAGKVVISKLNSAYYQSHYLTGKHITNDDNDNLDNNVDGDIQDDNNNDGKTNTDTDLKWYGDLIVLVLTILTVGGAVVFGFKAFNTKGGS